jgi:regulator of protease activity HflC (stomatin/prohibitin superfamily)
MEPELESVIGIVTAVTSVAAVLIGYLSERRALGAFIVGFFTAVAGGLCFLGMKHGDWIGLLAAVLLVTFLASRIGKSFGKERGAVFVSALWLGFCASCAIGYWAGGWLGLLTITLPSLIVFWGAMFGISRRLLPLRDRSQWGKAFRSLFTFSLGTNFPYHAIEGRELVDRVPGNPYGQFFAGPGIVLTGPAHAPIVWDGLRFKNVSEPGLTFTDGFEIIYQTVDLRPQLRSFDVEAITKDGIRIRVLTFIPFKLHARGREPKLKGSFPLDKKSIYKAVWGQPVEREQKRSWDEVVPIVATRLLRKIIGQYSFDELCEPLDPTKDPRVVIREELVNQLRQELQDYGIEIIGGGISNLEPVDSDVIEKRIEAWQAECKRKIAVVLGEGRAKAIWELERAHIQAQASLISAVRHVVEQRPGIDPDVLTKMAALRFIEAMEEMAGRPQVQEALPAEATGTIAYLRSALG